MAQKAGWASRRAIGARNEDGDQVAFHNFGQCHLVSQLVDRCAEAPDHGNSFVSRSLTVAIGDGHGVVTAHHRAEIAARRQLMVQPAIDDDEGLALALLHIDDAGQINAGLAD